MKNECIDALESKTKRLPAEMDSARPEEDCIDHFSSIWWMLNNGT